MLYKIVSTAMIATGIKKERIGPEILRQTAIINMFKKGHTLEEVRAFTGIKTLSRRAVYSRGCKRYVE